MSSFLAAWRNAPRADRDEVLHALRLTVESEFFTHLHYQTFQYPYAYRLHIADLEAPHDLPRMDYSQAIDCCNKTVPIYVCPSAASRFSFAPLIAASIQYWLHDQTFHPFRSDVEWGQFIGKIFQPRKPRPSHLKGFAGSPESLLNGFIGIHAAICNMVEQTQRNMMQPDGPDTVTSFAWYIDRELNDRRLDREHFVLQPLFRAILIIAHDDDYDLDIEDPGNIIVYIVRTGKEDGLSAPVSFETIKQENVTRYLGHEGHCHGAQAIKTTMRVALSFIQELERREVAAYGRHPDPAKACRDLRGGYVGDGPYLLDYATELGWHPDWEPFELPSSQWVDIDAHPEWLANYDLGWQKEWQRRIQRERNEAKETLGEKIDSTETGESANS